jgi:hypothetical protein
VDKKIEKKIGVIKNIYFFIAIIGIVAIFLAVSGFMQEHGNGEDILFGSLRIVVMFIIYYGLKLRKSWVIPLALIVSAYTLITLNIYPPSMTSLSEKHAETSVETDEVVRVIYIAGFLITTGLYFAQALFYSYQIYFFAQKKVRSFFSVKGSIIF